MTVVVEWMGAIAIWTLSAVAAERINRAIDRCVLAHGAPINQPPLPALVGKLRGGTVPPRFLFGNAARDGESQRERPSGESAGVRRNG